MSWAGGREFYGCDQETNVLGLTLCTHENDSSPICPYCRQCFCDAPAAYRRTFWLNAPQSLIQSRMNHKIQMRRLLSEEKKPADLSRPLILIAEDDRITRTLLTKSFEKMRYSVLVAENGVEAMKLARQHLPDLILTDALMPKMEGRELCKLLKEDAETKSIKIIIMTSIYTKSRFRMEAFRAFQADGYLNKPLDMVELNNLLEKLVTPYALSPLKIVKQEVYENIDCR